MSGVENKPVSEIMINLLTNRNLANEKIISFYSIFGIYGKYLHISVSIYVCLHRDSRENETTNEINKMNRICWVEVFISRPFISHTRDNKHASLINIFVSLRRCRPNICSYRELHNSIIFWRLCQMKFSSRRSWGSTRHLCIDTIGVNVPLMCGKVEMAEERKQTSLSRESFIIVW